MFKGIDFHIGCEIFIRKDDQILLGKRKNCYGAGTWALPGGHLEPSERLDEALCREVREELGAVITPNLLKLVSIVEDIDKTKNKQAIHVSFELKNPNFEPKLMEPEFCEQWRYFGLNDLPLDNFFKPHKKILDNYLAKIIYKF